MKIIRAILGAIIIVLDRLFTPKRITRVEAQQRQVDALAKNFILYQLEACPFCVKVRRAMKRMNISIELRDVGKNENHKSELLKGGGEYQLPCLRIQKDDGSVQWLYESSDIIQYLGQYLEAALKMHS